MPKDKIKIYGPGSRTFIGATQAGEVVVRLPNHEVIVRLNTDEEFVHTEVVVREGARTVSTFADIGLRRTPAKQ